MVTTSKWLANNWVHSPCVYSYAVQQFLKEKCSSLQCNFLSLHYMWSILEMPWTFSPRLCPQTRALGNPLRVVCCFSFIWLLCRESPIVPALLAPHLCSQLRYRITCNCVFFKGGGWSALIFPSNSSLFVPLSLLSPSSNRKFVFCHFPVATRRSLTVLLARFAGLSRGRAAEMIRLWRRVFQPRLPTNWFPVTWLQRRKVSF